MLALIVAWWPRIFVGYDPAWYHILLFYVSPIVLIFIAVRRFRDMQEGFKHSERMIKGQHLMQPPDPAAKQGPPATPSGPLDDEDGR